jgi:hypothetical protein
MADENHATTATGDNSNNNETVLKEISSNEKKHTAPPSEEVVGSTSDEDLALVQLDRDREIKLLAKLDLAFVPVIMFAYLTCFLDRSNIGL